MTTSEAFADLCRASRVLVETALRELLATSRVRLWLRRLASWDDSGAWARILRAVLRFVDPIATPPRFSVESTLDELRRAVASIPGLPPRMLLASPATLSSLRAAADREAESWRRPPADEVARFWGTPILADPAIDRGMIVSIGVSPAPRCRSGLRIEP